VYQDLYEIFGARGHDQGLASRRSGDVGENAEVFGTWTCARDVDREFDEHAAPREVEG
jgi:hypothetical protein